MNSDAIRAALWATVDNIRSPERRARIADAMGVWTFLATSKLPTITALEAFPGIGEIVGETSTEVSDVWELPYGERALIDCIVRWQQPKLIFEFGTYTGSTTLVIANASKPDAEVHTIDVPDGYNVDLDETIGSAIRRRPHRGAPIVEHRQYIELFDFSAWKGKVDLVYVDANHGYEQVMRDSLLALELLDEDGIIIWDDYQSAHRGVVRALNELGETYQVEHLAWSRLAVLRTRQPGAERVPLDARRAESPVNPKWTRDLLRVGLERLRHAYEWEAVVGNAHALYVDRPLPVVLATITGAIDFPGIVPMLTGFLINVGRPAAIIVVDDGTLEPGQRDCIASISPLVEFHVPTVDPAETAADALSAYSDQFPMGKKLAMLVSLSHSSEMPILYTDTDVWFSSRSQPLVDLLCGPIDEPRFMEDPSSDSLDSRAIPDTRPHVNSGFVIVPAGFDWSPALEESRDLIVHPEWFTEQTVVHRAFHRHGARSLPGDRFVLSWGDRHSLHDLAHNADIVVRHYVTPVRHKYWVMVHGGYANTARALAHRVRRT